MRRLSLAALLAVALLFSGAVRAQDKDLVIGMGGAVTSTDPHYHNLTTNSMVSRHFFDTLVALDDKMRPIPSLALSWKPVEDTVWEFKLRPGVKFHDGSDFTAEDAMASLKRPPLVVNSPSSFNLNVSAISEMTATDPLTLRIKTFAPAPLLPNDLSNIGIINKAAATATTNDFNSGKAMNGTGPYKFVDYVPGERITMTRFDGYWGGKEPWSKVIIRMMTNAPARVAALRAGDVQMIDSVPTADIAALKANPDVAVSSTVSNRIIYLHIDTARDPTPFATDKKGVQLAKNPLKDLRVRQAISKALNRPAIVERVMEGQAIAASQLLPDGFFGVNPKLQVEKYDVNASKKLLADAGFPNGFAITVHGPNDRYINDDKVLQAVAQMMTRVGIDTKVETMPWATFAGRAAKLDFSLLLVGWGADTGEVSSPLRSLLATWDVAKGRGPSNRGRYSNPKMDAVLDKAMVTVDDAAREKLLQEATEIAITDLGIIPLHYEVSSWATRKGLTYQGSPNQYTVAMRVRPAAS